MSVAVTPGHQYPLDAPLELLDAADLDALAQPVFQINPGTLHTAAFYAPGVLEKIANLGGPGLRGTYTVPGPSAQTIQAGFNLQIGTLTIDDAKPGDYVLVTPPASLALNLFFDGWVDSDSAIRLTAYNYTAGNISIPAGTALLVITYSV